MRNRCAAIVVLITLAFSPVRCTTEESRSSETAALLYALVAAGVVFRNPSPPDACASAGAGDENNCGIPEGDE